MTILVTGASGLLGSHIMAKLEQTNHRILAAIMPIEKETYCAPQGVEVVLNDAIIAGEVEDIDVVINCAFSRSNNAADLASGLDFTEKLLRGFELCGVKAVINISSQGVYKRLPISELSTEDSPIEPMDLYSMAKYAVEKLFLLSTIPHTTNVRLASLNMKQRFLYKFVEAVKNGQPIALNSPNVYASLLDVNDAARALVALALTPADQWESTYNLGLGKQYSLAEYAEMVQKIGNKLGYKASIAIDDNGNSSTAGMSIAKLQSLTSWKPEVTAEQMIEGLF